MKSVTTYLSFDGNCRSAMAFYHKHLGGELLLTPSLDAHGRPDGDPAARVLHSQLSRGAVPFLMASDPPGGAPQPGSDYSVSVDCDSSSEIERLFSAFGGNGRIVLPLQETAWGARFGMLVDQFGTRWMFNCQVAK